MKINKRKVDAPVNSQVLTEQAWEFDTDDNAYLERMRDNYHRAGWWTIRTIGDQGEDGFLAEMINSSGRCTLYFQVVKEHITYNMVEAQEAAEAALRG